MRQVAKYYVLSPKTQPFSPLDLAPALWLDASDTATITASSGSVSQWSDKSGNGYAAVQATAAAQPTTGIVTQGGLNALSFDGGDHMVVGSLDLTGGQQFSIWSVFTSASGTDQAIIEQTVNFNLTSGAFAVFRLANNRGFISKSGATLRAAWTTTETITTTAKSLVATHDGTLSTNETTGWVNGTLSGSHTQNENTNANNISADLYIGSRGGSGAFLNGRLCEIGIIKTVLTSQQIADLSAYLASKWGL